MSKICELCGKRARAGNRVSHSNRKTRRYWRPNLQRILTEDNGLRRRILVCTECLHSGRVCKPSATGRRQQIQESPAESQSV